MARNGSGTFSLPEAAFVYDTVISETAMNSNLNDIATALTGSIAADGQTIITANLPMNSKKLTGLAVGTAEADSATLRQIQAQAEIWCSTMTGTANSGVLTPSPAIAAYTDGLTLRWISSSSANTGAMTVAVSGLATKAVEINDAALAAGNHAASKMYEGTYDGTAFQIRRIASAIPANSGANSDITSLTGLTTDLSVAQGGTGGSTPEAARSNLGITAFDPASPGDIGGTTPAAGTFTELTLTTDLSVAQGGTGASTVSAARASLSAAALGANSDITSITGLTTDLSVAQGGTGVSTLAALYTALGISSGAPNVNLLEKNNPQMKIAQRGTSIAVEASWEVTLDNWHWREFGTIASTPATISQQTSGGVSGNDAWLKWLCTGAESPAAGDGAMFETGIEAANLRNLLDNSGDLPATRLSFDVIAHADGGSSITFPAKMSVYLRNPDGGRLFIKSVTIASANTWERISFNVAADTTVTFDDNFNMGMGIGFSMTAGSGRYGTNNAWQANGGNDHHVSGDDNWMDSTNNYIGITNIKWEEGSSETDLIDQSFSVGLLHCYRTCQKSYQYDTAPGTATNDAITKYMQGANVGAVTLQITFLLPVPMRAIATMSKWSYDGTSNAAELFQGGGGGYLKDTANKVNMTDGSADGKNLTLHKTDSGPPPSAYGMACHWLAEAEVTS